MNRPADSSLLRTRTGRSLALAILFLDLLVVAAAGWSIAAERRAAIANGARSSLNLARALSASLEGTLRQVDLVLLSAEALLQAHAGGRAPEELERELAALTRRLPIIEAIRAATPGGIVEHGVGVKPGTAVDITDRDYFQMARSSPGLAVSAALTSRVDGQRVVMIARRRTLPGGAFGGVVYAAVPIEALEAALAGVDVGVRGAVALRDRELALIARVPAARVPGGSLVQRPISPEMAALVAAGREEASFSSISPVDGGEKLNAYRRIAGGALHLIVAADAWETLADWRADATRTVVAALALVALSALVAWRLLRAWSREAEERVAARVVAEQADLIRELQGALAEVKTLSGLLPICAHCKKIRDDKGYWNRIENYIRDRSEAEFTHGICPECAERHFPEPPPGES